MAEAPSTVDGYIAGFLPDTRAMLEDVRATIRGAVPSAREAISYGIPSFQLDGRDIVYFAGWKGHISVYPLPNGDPELVREMAPYRAGKGTLRFPLTQPIPYPLIGRIAAQLVAERVEAAGRRSPGR
jgi:uncharacterized protein YdhG (YjbR/CyaY superfamily)